MYLQFKIIRLDHPMDVARFIEMNQLSQFWIILSMWQHEQTSIALNRILKYTVLYTSEMVQKELCHEWSQPFLIN